MGFPARDLLPHPRKKPQRDRAHPDIRQPRRHRRIHDLLRRQRRRDIREHIIQKKKPDRFRHAHRRIHPHARHREGNRHRDHQQRPQRVGDKPVVTHRVRHRLRIPLRLQIVDQLAQLVQRQIHRPPVDQQHQLRILPIRRPHLLRKRRRRQQLARLRRKRQLAPLLEHPPLPRAGRPRLRRHDPRRLAPLRVQLRHRHPVAVLREPAEPVEKPHAPLPRVVERHAVGRPHPVRRQRFRVALKHQLVAQRPRLLHRPRHHRRVEPPRQPAAQHAHAPHRRRQPQKADPGRPHHRQFVGAMQLPQHIDQRNQQRHRQHHREETRQRDAQIPPQHPAPRPEFAQRPEIVVEHLHHQQPARRDEHEPENLQPLAQEMSVKSVQRPR